MTALAGFQQGQSEGLPRLIEQAAAALARAATAAEVLDARERANVAYTAAKMASRLAKAKDAHDEVVAACRKAMADALIIEQQAQCRLADEYDAAQERGEVARRSDGAAIRDDLVPQENKIATVEDVGLTRKQVHEARFWRDAERDDPGIVRRTVDAMVVAGKEPTRAGMKRAITPKPPAPPRSVEHPASPPDEDRRLTVDEVIFVVCARVADQLRNILRCIPPEEHERLFAEIDAMLDRVWDEEAGEAEP